MKWSSNNHYQVKKKSRIKMYFSRNNLSYSSKSVLSVKTNNNREVDRYHHLENIRGKKTIRFKLRKEKNKKKTTYVHWYYSTYTINDASFWNS